MLEFPSRKLISRRQFHSIPPLSVSIHAFYANCTFVVYLIAFISIPLQNISSCCGFPAPRKCFYEVDSFPQRATHFTFLTHEYCNAIFTYKSSPVGPGPKRGVSGSLTRGERNSLKNNNAVLTMNAHSMSPSPACHRRAAAARPACLPVRLPLVFARISWHASHIHFGDCLARRASCCSCMPPFERDGGRGRDASHRFREFFRVHATAPQCSSLSLRG